MSTDPTIDTAPAIESLLVEDYRRMSPSQKMALVCSLTRAAEELAVQDVRRCHPDADDRELALRVASRRLAPELMWRAFGWDSRTDGY